MKLTDLDEHQFNKLLYSLVACDEAILWTRGKSAKVAIDSCKRGDWLLWIFSALEGDKKQLFLAKGHCAGTVIHLMKDKRSVDAVNTAIKYGCGLASEQELADAYAAAYTAADYAAAYATAAYAAAYTAYAAAASYYAAAASYCAAAAYCAAASDSAAFSAAYASDSAAYDSAAAYADSAAKNKNRMETANICRNYLDFSQLEVDLSQL